MDQAGTRAVPRPRAVTGRRVAPWLRALAGVAVVVALVWRVGAGSVLSAVGDIGPGAVAAAVLATALATVCSAYRWRVVAGAMGVGMPLRTALAACYRSQFLNTVLPGGVLGDVERGVRHGRRRGVAARGLRSVAWERLAGQVVQVVVAVVVLAVVASPVRETLRPALAVAGVIVVVGTVGGLVVRRFVTPPRSLVTAWAEVRAGLLARHTGPVVAVLSLVAVGCHVLTFVVAARVSGVTATTAQVLPLALLSLLAMTLPLGVAGWGPREGVAAWAFGAAGIGVAQGLQTAVVYGVLVLLSCLPGGAVLLLDRSRGARRSGATGVQPAVVEPVRG